MSRKVRSRNKKIGAKQLRILEKYKEIRQIEYSIYDRSKVAKEFRKMTVAKKEVERWKNLLANTDLKLTPLEIRKIRDKMYQFRETFVNVKESFYRVKDRNKIANEFASDIRAKVKETSGEEWDNILDEIDEAIEANRDTVEELMDRLENYRAGDKLITDFYHKYGFDSISESTVYAFGILEGYIVQ